MNNSRFNYVPMGVDLPRSTFQLTHKHLTTFSAGKLYPMFNFHVLPGDTISIDTSFLSRMLTPIHPVMDDAYIDFYYFFVPYRLCWEHWKEFMVSLLLILIFLRISILFLVLLLRNLKV